MTRRSILLIAAAFALLYALIGLFRHWQFGSNFDLAIFDQAVWHLSRFEAPASTISGYANILGDHFYPVIALFAPWYWIAPVPETLIVAQAILLASSIVPVFLFLRGRLPGGSALALAVAYGLFWGVQRTAMFDVHEMAFAPVLIATAILAIDRRRWGLLWMASAMLVLTKEDLIPLVAGFGGYLIFLGERRRGGLLLTASLTAFVLVVTVAIPFFSDSGEWSTGGAYDALWRRPWTAPVILVTPPEKMWTVLNWLAPFLFLPLCSPLGGLALPIAAERLLSAVSNHWGAGAHYSAPLAPILAMSAGDGLARLSRRVSSAPARRRVVNALAGASVLVSAFLPGHQPLWRLLSPKHYAAQPSQEAAHRALASIPPAASVVAQTAIAPHLSQRREIFVLKAGAPDADFVIASLDLDPWPAATKEDISSLIEERRQRGYATVFADAGWIVLRR